MGPRRQVAHTVSRARQPSGAEVDFGHMCAVTGVDTVEV
ncbi:hypothetical protein N798_05230 [Knoellia flava TL1]|uniref:Uncharacterized protein n=1 Tax=Knoellia flava TL1 TaxID=1385518 RepID=A0ABR4XG94_9MICO|nr:hypothetical protein N798_05230 [Knoellia flava TL1]